MKYTIKPLTLTPDGPRYYIETCLTVYRLDPIDAAGRYMLDLDWVYTRR